MGRLDGKRVLIPGTGRGIGRAAALVFAAEGATIASCDLDGPAQEKTSRLVREAGGAMVPMESVDIATEEGAEQWVDWAVTELGGIDVRANVVLPGLIRTPETEPLFQRDDQPAMELVNRSPTGRAGVPEDIAKVAAFLASDDSAFVNAAEIRVDGGQSMMLI